MKKFSILVLALILLVGMLACKGTTTQPEAETTDAPTEAPTDAPTDVPAPDCVAEFAGTWVLGSCTYGGVIIDPTQLGMEITAVLNKDLTCTLTMTDEDDQSGTWEYADGAILLTDATETMTFAYDEETDSLSVEQDDMTMVLYREGKVPVVTVTDAPTGIQAEDIVGTWTLSHATAYGIEIPASELGTDMTVILNADSSGTFISGDTNVAGCTWTIEITEGVAEMVLSYAGTEMLRLAYDGTYLFLTTDSEGVEVVMYFARTA